MNPTTTAALTQHAFNWIDFTILAIIGFSILISFFRGLIREAVSLGFWIVGLLVALKFATPVHLYLAQWIGSPALRYLVAFMGLFLIVFIVGVVTNMIIHAMIKAAGLTFTDRILGIVFGFVRGTVVVAVMLLFVNAGTLRDTQAIQQSMLAPQFMPLVKWLQQFLPDHMKTVSSWVQPGVPVQVPSLTPSNAQPADSQPTDSQSSDSQSSDGGAPVEDSTGSQTDNQSGYTQPAN